MECLSGQRMEAFELWSGEDPWESLAQQGDQTSQFLRKSNLNTHLKDWCWSWSSNIFWLPDAKSWLTGKDSDAGKEWRQEEKGTTEHEMVGWHQLNGHEFEQALGVGEGQGSLACCIPWGHKESDTTEWLKNNNIKKEWNWVTCSDMNGPSIFHIEWSKRKTVQVNLFAGQEYRLRYSEWTCRHRSGGEQGWDELQE